MSTAQRMACDSLEHSAVSLKIGRLVTRAAEGQLLVDFDGNRQGPVAARALSSVPGAELVAGTEVLLCFPQDAAPAPVIVGVLAPPASPSDEVEGDARPQFAEVDGKRVAIEGQEEIVLRCGEASITLRSNGKVVIRGIQIESRAAGTNRIKGGCVQLN